MTEIEGRHKFSTAVGACEIEWTESGICRFRLPDASRVHGKLNVGAVNTEGLPPLIAETVALVRQVLSGTRADLSKLRLDLSYATPFNRRVYECVLTIPFGKTMTYGEVAREVGEPGGAQAVGRAMADNKIPLIVPCHRVLAADGKMHGFSAPGGTASKRKLLEIEGAIEPEPPTLFDFVDAQNN
ncbi:methylated-DNA--[protein]-cysteine S-methyltransferase [Kordiimonas sp.]|uniref:methylated-DNA--[protein]-cysteine S-methyltransferase n=1 Tax=Kordiimonas sp. TaxID=1970157 RepID=UPI003A952DAA